MKVLYFFSKESGGGISTFIRQINRLSSKEIKLHFIFLKKNRIRILNETIINKYYFNNIFLRCAIFVISFFKLISFTLNIKNPGAVFITLDIYSFIILSLLKRLKLVSNFKQIAIINTNYPSVIKSKPNYFLKKVLFSLSKYCFTVPDKLVFVSNSLRNFNIKTFGIPLFQKRCLVINNGVDINTIKKTKSKHIHSLVSFGRLDKQKDYFTIIDAMKIIYGRHRIKTNLTIIGDGPQKDIIMQYAVSKNVACRIMDWKADPRKFIRKYNIFVFSSFYEGFGRSIIEAMSVGLPVVATDTAFGPSEIIGKNKYGLLTSVNNPNGMAEAIFKLIKKPKLWKKYSSLSLLRASYYSEEKMLFKYKKLLLSI